MPEEAGEFWMLDDGFWIGLRASLSTHRTGSTLLDDGADTVPDVVELVRFHPSDRTPDTNLIGRHHAMRQGKTRVMQTAGIEIFPENRGSLGMSGAIAGDLAEDHIAPGQRSQHQGQGGLWNWRGR